MSSPTNRHRRVRRVLGAGGMISLGLLPALGVTRPQPAAAEGSFSGIAAADGVQVGVTSKGFLLVEGGSAGLPSAQAVLDSLGQSTAYAAFPYPTEAALIVPGLAASAGGPELPRYPLIAQSSHPTTPSATVEKGPVHLQAESAERSSKTQAVAAAANAADGTTVGRTESDAGVAADLAGPVTSTAASTVEAFSAAGGTLRVGRVHSAATVARGPGEDPKVTSSLEVAQVTVAGQTVSFGEGGLVFPGGPAAAAPANPLAAALADAGVTVRYLAPVRTPDGAGIVSAGIEVRVTRQVTETGPTTASYVLGRSFAYVGAVTAPAVPDAGGLTDSGDLGPGPGGSAPAAPAPPLPGRVGPATAAQVPAGLGAGLSSSAGVSGSGTSGLSGSSGFSGSSTAGDTAGSPSDSFGAASGAPSAESLLAAPATNGRVVSGFDVGGSYLAIVLAALAIAGGSQLLRILGVRLA